MEVKEKKVRKDLLPMFYPKIPPEKMVADFMRSKREQKAIKKFPEWDNPRMSPQMDLVIAKRKLAEADKRLAETRQGAGARRRDLDAQWKDMEDKEDLFKQSFIKFSKFVRENFEKRERAEKKLEEEIQLQIKRDKDIQELTHKYQEMQAVKANMEQHIREYRIYENFLTGVLGITSDFKSVNDILDRYDAINEARGELTRRQEKELVSLENARGDMMALIEEQIFALMALNNQVANLQSRYEAAKSRALHWETIVTQIKNVVCQLTAEMHQVKLCCWEIYLQMCRRKKSEPDFHVSDVENQILFIKATLTELARIGKIAKRRGAKEAGSLVASAGVSN